ncbi:MAG: 16S rRNA (guanine(527)-N(7))-methyltransferase RsmG [Proteobacteria bacterium]|nr:16S rRNA (guanine(527)-N(7))-methyltransferase RsmG [Pseudomonadota bacterium]
MTPTAQLAQGIAELGLLISADIQTQLADHLALIAKWNRVHNLTAVRESAKMVSVHALDSLAVVPHLKAGSVVDVGSGAGLPGIPLALMWPQVRVVLLDSNHKKAVFLRQAAIELRLKNVEVVCERAESWRPGHHCAAGGVLAAMKGVYPDEELAQLPSTFRLHSALPLKVPGLHAERHLILLNPVSA